jgi:hypothetical protein
MRPHRNDLRRREGESEQQALDKAPGRSPAFRRRGRFRRRADRVARIGLGHVQQYPSGAGSRSTAWAPAVFRERRSLTRAAVSVNLLASASVFSRVLPSLLM